MIFTAILGRFIYLKILAVIPRFFLVNIREQNRLERGILIIGFFQKREIPWEKVPFVPRPSLVPEPVTAFGRRSAVVEEKEKKQREVIVIKPLDKARIRPKLILPQRKPYIDPREETRERVFSAIRKEDLLPRELPSGDAMDVVLPKLHKIAELPDLPYKRRIALASSYY
ncbi:hypothetical protein FQA39_LY18163 [Lamprigera yunnana]|nr:hypothetical protein FQA39_LY18163 [Lamprigera yunnana]